MKLREENKKENKKTDLFLFLSATSKSKLDSDSDYYQNVRTVHED